MEGILSQEEIDALLGGGSSDDEEDYGSNDSVNKSIKLTKEEIDAIGEMGNISIGSSSTALSTLLGKNVLITTPKVEVYTFDELKQKSSYREKVLIQIEYKSGFSGLNILLINKRDAIIIGDLMMGNDGTSPPDDLDDLYLSAVGESMNQMMGSASTSLAGMFSKEIDINPPEISVSSIEELKLKTDFFKRNPEFIVVEFNMEIEGLVNTNLYQIMDLNFLKEVTKLMFAMGGNSDTSSSKKSSSTKMKSEPQMQQPMYGGWQQPPQMQQPMQGGWQQPPINVQPVQFASFGENNFQNMPSNIDLIMDVPLQVTVELGRTKMQIKEILDLGAGSIVELDKLAGEPVDVRVNGKLIAKGEVVVIDESFGVRITDIVSQMERLNKVQ